MSLYDQLVQIQYNLKPNIEQKPIINNITGSWMKSVFGFSDKELMNNANNNLERSKIIDELLTHTIIYDDKSGMLNTPNGLYRAGWFVTPTVEEIKELVSRLDINPGKPEIKIIPRLDVGLAHTQSEPYEIFQGASQFNALEMISQDNTPYEGIENYINDRTQGPRTALICAPGTIIRNYWVTKQYGGQFNALEKLGLSHLNGYLVWGTNPREILNKLNPDSIMIPCMLYTQVNGILISDKIQRYISDKLVHQIYSSAVPINTYRNGGNLDDQYNIATKIITAEYIGVIGMGLILHIFDKTAGRTSSNKPKINITLIGGGIFNVPIDIIINSLKTAINTFKNYDFDLLVHAYTNVEDTRNRLSDIMNEKYLLVIPRDKKLLIYDLLPYQQEMLDQLLSGSSYYNKNDIKAKLYNLGGRLFFQGEDGKNRYFVKLSDPRIGSYARNNDGSYILYDKFGKEITNW